MSTCMAQNDTGVGGSAFFTLRAYHDWGRLGLNGLRVTPLPQTDEATPWVLLSGQTAEEAVPAGNNRSWLRSQASYGNLGPRTDA